MNIKKTLLSALVAMVGFTANAQDECCKTEYVFQPHWYVQGQIGGQYTLGEIGFGDLLSPTAQVGVGYNFNEVIGLRLSVNAWQSKAGIDGKYLSDGKQLDWKWNYVAPMIDVRADLTNLICGYNPNRLVNVGVFGGVGANIAWGNDDAQAVKAGIDNQTHALVNDDYENQYLRYLWDGTKVRFAGKVGADVNFRINDQWSAGLEMSANLTGDRYNSKKAGNADWYFNAMVGVKYNLGKTYTTREKKCCKPTEPQIIYKDRIVEKIVEKPVPSTAGIAKAADYDSLRMDVFFTIASTKVLGSEAKKIEAVANFLNKHPQAKVTVTGYADKGTGNATINRNLSVKRADIVKNELIKKYKIAADRIITDAKGDTVQPYDVDVLNRVSICIAK